jgi:predicted HTH domain antitoxin
MTIEKHNNNKQEEIIIKLYTRQRLTIEKISETININAAKVSKILKDNDITIRDKYTCGRKYYLNQHFFDVINDERRAYYLGLIYADGCNHIKSNKLTIGLQEGDRHILESFKKDLESNIPIRFRKGAKSGYKNSSIFVVNCHYFSRALLKLGVMNAKSLILKFPNKNQVPPSLIKHFIRGYFDGDGSFSCYYNKKENVYKYCAAIISTECFCKSLNKIFNKELQINTDIRARFPDRNNSNRTLTISGKNQVYKFLDWIYDDAHIFLERKYIKYKESRGLTDKKPFRDLTKEHFNFWEVLEFFRLKNRTYLWKCRCRSCGRVFIRCSQQIINPKSLGCQNCFASNRKRIKQNNVISPSNYEID